MTEEMLPESDRIDTAPHPRETLQLIGQSKAEASFLEAYASGRLHHAWIIGGSRGIGKATLAWRIARFLLSTEPSGMFGGPEGLSTPKDHPVIRRIAALAEPGVFICRRPWDPKAKRLKTAITVDEVRKLKSFFTLSAADGGWRIAIVDAADELNNAAANALLKILEEPPEKAMVILVSHQPSKLLPTIRSRCRMLRCETLSAKDIAAAMANAGFENMQSDALAELSGGSPGDAIQLIADDGVEVYKQIIGILGKAPNMPRPAINALADSCVSRNNQAHYATVTALINLAIVRLARHGNGVVFGAAAPDEPAVFQLLSSRESQARIWADLQQNLTTRIAHARAVNLDPALVILDTFLKIETAAAQAMR